MDNDSWMEKKIADMTESEKDDVIRKLKKELVSTYVTTRQECKYRLPCGVCEKTEKFCSWIRE